MAERLKNGQLRSWLDGAHRGDLQATVQLHNYLFPRLVRKVDGFLTEGLAPVLVEAALGRVDERLPDLMEISYRNSPRTLSNRVIGWGLTQLNGVIQDYTNPRTKFKDKIEDFIPDYMVRVTELVGGLLPAPREAVELMIYQDKTIPEISGDLGISLEAVRQRLYRARQTIEPELIDPFGIIRVSMLNDKTLQMAVRDRRMESFQFLDLWYTDEQGVTRYRNGLGNRGKDW